MARWKALPEGLPAAVVLLVAELRRLKDHSGVSLNRLAARTDYSASSWDRYLGGRLLPPRAAVESLARATGADPVPLLALHQAADEAWQSAAWHPAPPESGGGDDAGDPDAPDASDMSAEPATSTEYAAPAPASMAGPVQASGPTAPQATHRSWRTIISSAIGALAGAAIALAVVQPWDGTRACATVAPPVPPIVPAATKYVCHYSQAGGLWEAGYSTTTTTTVMVGMDSPVVVELQCMLQHAGFTPGGIDGSFGPMTEKAVVQFQVAKHLEIDGQVGPQTWGALRRSAAS